jgi:uncharacterized protein
MSFRREAQERAAPEVPPAVASTGSLRPGALAAFVALAYVLSWGWMLPLVLSGSEVVAGVGWPTHVPALVGPMAAALLVAGGTGGRAAVQDLLHRMVSARCPLRWWTVALSPVLLLLAIGTASVLGWTSLDPAGLAQFPGIPAGWGGVGVVATVVLVNGFGEETGWRGYVQPLLQRRHGPLVATLGVAAIWAVWHLPMFLVLASFQSFGPGTLVGWCIGLLSGAVVLAWLYNRSGGSILLVAVWHAGYNLVSATAIGAGFLGAASTVLVILGATVLVVLELVRTRSGRSSVLLPQARTGAAAGRRTERGDSSDT